MTLFSEEKTELNLPNAKLEYVPHFLDEKDANRYFEHFLKQIEWQQDDITVFGKTYAQPRLTALYGESEKPYSYSNITMVPKKFTDALKELKKRIENYSGHTFSSVLLNLYRDGNDSNGWHADNEKELGENPVIASLSLGAERKFNIKHRRLKEQRHQLILQHGSLFLMQGEMQHHWLHQIPKTKKMVGPRINLTFRKIGKV